MQIASCHTNLFEHMYMYNYQYMYVLSIFACFGIFHSSVNSTDILMIDGMVEVMGRKVGDLWHAEGGSGLYPPCSLHVSDRRP